jgi:hypothetical protein
MLIKTLRFVTILLVALLSGLAFAHVLERPAKMLYDAALYLTIQKTLYVDWGPPNIGGFLEPVAIFATLLLAFFLHRKKRAFWLTLVAGFALLLAFPVVFTALVAPANEVFLGATPTSIPLIGWSSAQTGKRVTPFASGSSYWRSVCSSFQYSLMLMKTVPDITINRRTVLCVFLLSVLCRARLALC